MVFNSAHIVCFSIVLIASMLILSDIVISDIGLVNIVSDQDNGSRREHFAKHSKYGVRCTVPRFSDTGAGLA